MCLAGLLNSLSTKKKDRSNLSVIGGELQKISKIVALSKERETFIEQLELSTLLFNQSGDSILIATADGEIVDANPAFYRSTGFTPESALGKQLGFSLASQTALEDFSGFIKEAVNEGISVKEIFTKRNDESVFPELLTISPVVKDGEVENIVVFSKDISEQKEREGKLLREAKRDKLTGIFNREGFETRLQAAIDTNDADKSDFGVGVLFLDLDEFKPVNDTYGHDVGDQLLISVANRISNTCSDIETVARLGGDEFVCVFPICKDKQELEYKAKQVLASLSAPIQVENLRLPIKCSIGAAIYPHDASTIEELTKASDVAMYQAKTAGKNQIRVYDPAFKSQEQEFEELASKLEYAARNNKLNLAFHPIFNSSGDVYCYDVLLRWFSEDGEISPTKFIKVAEKYDLMEDLYGFILRSLAFNSKIKQHLSEGVLFSIKLEEKAIKSERFAQDLLDKLEGLSLPRNQIVVRVDEQVVAANFRTALSNINLFEDSEVKVCLDDFCVGEISILNRVNLRSTLAKLPRELVRELTASPNKVHILNSVFALASAMNTVVVVEGVESEKAMNMFVNQGVEFVQGNHLHEAILDNDLPNSSFDIQGAS